jgi:hypothetical protein
MYVYDIPSLSLSVSITMDGWWKSSVHAGLYENPPAPVVRALQINKLLALKSLIKS